MLRNKSPKTIKPYKGQMTVHFAKGTRTVYNCSKPESVMKLKMYPIKTDDKDTSIQILVTSNLAQMIQISD